MSLTTRCWRPASALACSSRSVRIAAVSASSRRASMVLSRKTLTAADMAPISSPRPA